MSSAYKDKSTLLDIDWPASCYSLAYARIGYRLLTFTAAAYSHHTLIFNLQHTATSLFTSMNYNVSGQKGTL